MKKKDELKVKNLIRKIFTSQEYIINEFFYSTSKDDDRTKHRSWYICRNIETNKEFINAILASISINMKEINDDNITYLYIRYEVYNPILGAYEVYNPILGAYEQDLIELRWEELEGLNIIKTISESLQYLRDKKLNELLNGKDIKS